MEDGKQLLYKNVQQFRGGAQKLCVSLKSTRLESKKAQREDGGWGTSLQKSIPTQIRKRIL